MDSRWLALALIFVTRTSMGVQFQSIASVGLAAARLGALATATSWRTSLVVAAATAALGLVLMASVFREAPQRAAPGARAALGARDTGLALASGLAWGVFNASLVAVIAFGPAMLVARGVSLGQAG